MCAGYRPTHFVIIFDDHLFRFVQQRRSLASINRSKGVRVGDQTVGPNTQSIATLWHPLSSGLPRSLRRHCDHDGRRSNCSSADELCVRITVVTGLCGTRGITTSETATGNIGSTACCRTGWRTAVCITCRITYRRTAGCCTAITDWCAAAIVATTLAATASLCITGTHHRNCQGKQCEQNGISHDYLPLKNESPSDDSTQNR